MAEKKLEATEVHSKVGAGALGGAVTVVAVWVMGVCGLDVPAEVSVALGTIVAFAFGYVAKSPEK